MTTEKSSLISEGTEVRTTEANYDKRDEWTDKAWKSRQWGVQGVVVLYNDNQEPYYEVRHPDGSTGWYDHSELEVVTQ